MNLPQIPTDNLYKYLNVGGLTLFIFCLTTFLYTSSKVESEWRNYKSQISKNATEFNINITQKLSHERRHDLLKGMLMTKYKLKYFPINPSETNSLKDFNAFYKDFLLLEEANIKIEEYDKKIALGKQNLKEQEDKTKLVLGRWKTYSLVLFILGIFSFIVCIASGFFWYFKSQRLIDKQLVLKSTSDEILKLKLDAAKVFNLLVINLYPIRYWEELEYEDYFQDIAREFQNYHKKLNEYRKRYSLIFDNKMIKEIKMVENLCEEGRFEVDGGGVATMKGLSKAEELIKKMEEINTNIKESVSIYTH